ncbi:MAG TPA: MFS transporter [Rhodopila sp.]|nr:MFS transporter [Rhodopila sp.]
MTRPTAPVAIRRRQRAALIMLVIAGTLNYLDRSTLSIANPLIRQELGLSIADMGLLLSAFLWAYAFAQLPGGALVDRVGPHRLLATGLGLWSIAQAAAGLVTSFWQFSIARIFLGLGEAPMFSSAVRVVRDWYNVRPRCGHGNVELHVLPRPGPGAADPDGADDRLRLALDVRQHGHRRRGRRCCLVLALS